MTPENFFANITYHDWSENSPYEVPQAYFARGKKVTSAAIIKLEGRQIKYPLPVITDPIYTVLTLRDNLERLPESVDATNMDIIPDIEGKSYHSSLKSAVRACVTFVTSWFYGKSFSHAAESHLYVLYDALADNQEGLEEANFYKNNVNANAICTNVLEEDPYSRLNGELSYRKKGKKPKEKELKVGRIIRNRINTDGGLYSFPDGFIKRSK